MAAFVPRVIPRQPPEYHLGFVEMHRFSPIFERRDAFGVTDYEIRPDYLFNFPEGAVDLRKVGYFFNYSSSKLVDRAKYADRVLKAVGAWIAAHKGKEPPTFEYRIHPGFTRVIDGRGGALRSVDVDGLAQDVFLLCDEAVNPKKIRALLAARYPAEVADGGVEKVVEAFLEAGLIMREGPLVLALHIGARPRSTEALHRHVFGDGALPVVEADG